MSLVQIRMPRGTNEPASPATASGFVVRKEQRGVGIEWIELAALQPADLRAVSAQRTLRQSNATAWNL
jgi:hypothetical protein